MPDEVSIDVVICTFNNAGLLDRTLEALQTQILPPGVDWRILVVDNNCTDETPEVVAHRSLSSPVPLRRVAEPIPGLTPARVCGVRNTSATWIAFVDDDCLLADDWIEQAARFAEEHPECGAFGGRIVLDWEVPPPEFIVTFPFAFAGKNHGDTAKRRPWVAGAGMVVRREAIEACGWVDEQFLADRVGRRPVSGGDMEIALRIAARYEVWYNPRCSLRHVIPVRRMSREYLRKILFELGASRHNADALTWRGSYSSWLPYSAALSAGFAVAGLARLGRGLVGPQERHDGPAALGPTLGWWSAMWTMLRMETSKRRRLLGCAVKLTGR
ncbi:MAG: glycosyltransferase family 2 protein [Gemmatimonadota bacterium]|nr:glycosyltransferase family 2 protein [Gemmatimonadota bacterium]